MWERGQSLPNDDELKMFEVSEKQLCILFQSHIDIFSPQNNKTNAALTNWASIDKGKHD